MTRKTNHHLQTPEVRRKADATRIARMAEIMMTKPFEDIKSKIVRKKRIMIEQGNLCAICNGEPFHFGKPLNFHLDHANGENSDNSRANLRMICPNCHSQTPTYCGRNVRLKRLQP